jgi:hypothetical protein
VLAGCVVAIVLGLALAREVAAWHLRVRADAVRSGSLLNAERAERQVESFDNPRSLALEVWALRATGVVLVAGGLVPLIA